MYVRWARKLVDRCARDDVEATTDGVANFPQASVTGEAGKLSRVPRALIRATIPRELIAGRTFDRLVVSWMRSRAKLGAVYRPDRK